MKWFQKRKETAAAAAVQLRETGRHPFGELGSYAALRSGETRLYRAVREAVRVVDAGIYTLIRMTGGVTASCADPSARPADRAGGAGTVRHQCLFGWVHGFPADLWTGHR